MNSFPFVRHHFLRSGFEVIDCPPLTAQLKNSADIRMVMDARDYLTHETYFDEFIILSSDADFTPLLHRLRAHARRTVIFTNDHTAAPYKAICDGSVRESDLLTLLLTGSLPSQQDRDQAADTQEQPTSADLAIVRKEIIAEVVSSVRAAGQPVPLEALADRAVRAIGHDKTAGTSWAGAGGFRDLLLQDLPTEMSISPQPPYFVFDSTRQVATQTPPPTQPHPAPDHRPVGEHRLETSLATSPPSHPDAGHAVQEPAFNAPGATATTASLRQHKPQSFAASAPEPTVQPVTPQAPEQKPQSLIQQSIARIHEASQAPPLSPPEYRVLFQKMAEEITSNNLSGAQTLDNIAQRCKDADVDVRRDDIRFVLEVVSEADPWFEQGASGNLFASRFRNFVVARCRSQGLSLSANELDLVEAWFGTSSGQPASALVQSTSQSTADASHPVAATGAESRTGQADPWWELEEARQHVAQSHNNDGGFGQENELGQDDFPRIIRSRLRN